MLESEINEKYFIKFLKGYEKKSNLSLDLNLYREFQKFEEELHSEFNSYDDLPHDISYVMKCFTKLKLLGMALSLNESEKLKNTLVKLAEVHNERGVKAIECKSSVNSIYNNRLIQYIIMSIRWHCWRCFILVIEPMFR